MFNDKFKRRYVAFISVAMALICVLLYANFSLVIINAEEYQAQAPTTSQKTVTVQGKRGSIYDSNNIALAYDESSYDVTFYRDPTRSNASDRADYTRIIAQTISIVESNGGSTIDTFLIRKDKNGKFYFNFTSLDNDPTMTAEKVEQAKISRLGNWCVNMSIPEDMLGLSYTLTTNLLKDSTKKAEAYQTIYENADAEEIYYYLRSKYRLDENVSYDSAVKLLSIWQESQLMSYRSYIPVTVAYDVDNETVSKIEALGTELTGMSIESSNTRVYPRNAVACHIVGYLGRLSENDDIDSYLDLGYTTDDSIGRTGVESTMEQYLTASTSDKKGERIIEVDSSGAILGEVSSTPAQNGNDVYLTVDLKLQEVLEDALEKNITQVREVQESTYKSNQTEYDSMDSLTSRYNNELKALQDSSDEKASSFTKLDALNLCNSGAAIAMDVETGDVLALASIPGYDLNLFTGGISDSNYQALLNAEGSPMFNVAISSTSTPGSVFKMATAIAGLEEGVIDLNTHISCQYKYLTAEITDEATAPACWTSNTSKHANQDVSDAIKNSCNYFFVRVTDLLGLQKLTEWVDKLGLTSKTGIELPNEAQGFIGSQQVLYDNTKDIDPESQGGNWNPQLVYNAIINLLKQYASERNVTYTDQQYSTAANRIIVLGGDSDTQVGPKIRTILSEVFDIPENVSRASMSNELAQLIAQLRWTQRLTVTQGAGLTPSQYTPIAIARYICAIANGGEVLTPHIVDKVVDESGNTVYQTEKEVVTDIGLSPGNRTAIIKGMEEVFSEEAGGTAASSFRSFKYKNYLAGKTGTAPVSDIDLEDNIWLVSFAPKDDPKVALVVFLPNGLSEGVGAAPTAIAFWQYYFDNIYNADDSSASSTPTESQSPSEGSMII